MLLGFFLYLLSKTKQNMKSKLIILAFLGILIYSCSPKIAPAPSKAPAPVTVVSNNVATVLTPELAAGKNLYENNCSKCHKLYDPKDFSKEDWKPIVLKMQKKAHLEDADGQKIYDYLTSI